MKKIYVAPSMKVITVNVERGFAGSNGLIQQDANNKMSIFWDMSQQQMTDGGSTRQTQQYNGWNDNGNIW